MRHSVLIALCLLPVFSLAADYSKEQLHQRMLDKLGIEALRRGADGDPSSPYAANYDEGRANERMHTLPDVLAAPGQAPAQTAADWHQRVKPALRDVFAREIYGRVPEGALSVTWQRAEAHSETFGEQTARVSELTGIIRDSADSDRSVSMTPRLAIPVRADEPVPVVIALSFDPAVWEMFRQRMEPEQYKQMMAAAKRWKEQVLAAGWGFVEYYPTQIQPDDAAKLTEGVIGLANNGEPRSPEDWGALRAWGWGASRMLDYLETLPQVDASRVLLHGHSRYGKAALVGLAFDDRFAGGYISASGEGGAKLWRRHYGEQVGNIASSTLHHWVAGNFLKYAGPLTESDIPVDAHQLIALSAPRPLFFGAGSDGGDVWTDPRGMLLAGHYASPVYRLLGGKGLDRTTLPAVNEADMSGDIAWRYHHLGHTPAPNWPAVIEFYSRYF